MDNSLQKEFQFESLDERSTFRGPAPVFTVRKADEEGNRNREEQLLKLRKDYSSFIRDGWKFAKSRAHFAWKYYRNDVMNKEYDEERYDEGGDSYRPLDDAKYRFSRCIDYLETDIHEVDFSIAFVTCNLVLGLGEIEREQIYKKILEMNPSWIGEYERMRDYLKSLSHPKTNDNGNFKDLSLKTTFVKNKHHLKSLMEEIKKDVFGGDGKIMIDIPLKPFWELADEYRHVFMTSFPPFENIMYFSKSPSPERDIRNYFKRTSTNYSTNYSTNRDESLEYCISALKKRALMRGRSEKNILPVANYIGIIEHGNDEIRVIAQMTDFSNTGLFMYWDTFIDEMIPTLRTAIKWWIDNGKPLRRRYAQGKNEILTDQDEDTSWMDEAMDISDELDEYYDND